MRRATETQNPHVRIVSFMPLGCTRTLQSWNFSFVHAPLDAAAPVPLLYANFCTWLCNERDQKSTQERSLAHTKCAVSSDWLHYSSLDLFLASRIMPGAWYLFNKYLLRGDKWTLSSFPGTPTWGLSSYNSMYMHCPVNLSQTQHW